MLFKDSNNHLFKHKQRNYWLVYSIYTIKNHGHDKAQTVYSISVVYQSVT